MPVETIKFEGASDLDTALGALTKGQAKGVLSRILKRAAGPTLTAMKANSPRETGALIGSEIIGTKLNKRQARFRKQDGKDFAEVYVGTNDPAGRLQEFGTFKEPAQPWARPAWDATQDEAFVIIASDLGAEIEKTRARVAKRAERLAARG